MGFKMGNYGLGFFLQITSCHVSCLKEDYQVGLYISNVMGYHYEKKWVFCNWPCNSIKTIHFQLLCNSIMGANLLRNTKKLSLGHL